MLNTGSKAPDGTTVNFKVICVPNNYPGTVTPFAQTTNGVAQAIFTAPPVPATCTITGKIAGVTIGIVDILVTTSLKSEVSGLSESNFPDRVFKMTK